MTTTTRRNPLAAREAQPVALASEGRETEQLKIDQIRTDGGTQMRAGINDATVVEYSEAIIEHNGWPFPPVTVFHDGTHYWLGDGFHRLAAMSQHNPQATVPATVRSGTRRDAVLFAAAANADHGLRRTNADKWRAVEVLLNDDEWNQWSNREIARRCKVSEFLVRTVREKLHSADRPQYAPPTIAPVTAIKSQSESARRTYTTRHGTLATMNVTGQRQAAQSRTVEASVPKPAPTPAPQPAAQLAELPADLVAAGFKLERRADWYLVSYGTQFATHQDMQQAVAWCRRIEQAAAEQDRLAEAEEADEADEPQPKALVACSHRHQWMIMPTTKSPGISTTQIYVCEDCGHFQVVLEVSFQRHTIEFVLDSEEAVEAAAKGI